MNWNIHLLFWATLHIFLYINIYEIYVHFEFIYVENVEIFHRISLKFLIPHYNIKLIFEYLKILGFEKSVIRI